MAYERQEWSNITCGHLDLDGMRKTYVEAMTSVLKAFGAIVEPKSAHQQN
jgi:hypothetical protein